MVLAPMLTDTAENLLRYFQHDYRRVTQIEERPDSLLLSAQDTLTRASQAALVSLEQSWLTAGIVCRREGGQDRPAARGTLRQAVPMDIKPLAANCRRVFVGERFTIEFQYLRRGRVIYTVVLSPVVHLLGTPGLRRILAERVPETDRIDPARLATALRPLTEIADPFSAMQVEFFDSDGRPLAVKRKIPNPYPKYDGTGGRTELVDFDRWFPRGGYAVVRGP